MIDEDGLFEVPQKFRGDIALMKQQEIVEKERDDLRDKLKVAREALKFAEEKLPVGSNYNVTEVCFKIGKALKQIGE